MLITILAVIGLYFIILVVYRKGRRDGIMDTIAYFQTEMNRKEINAEVKIFEKQLEKSEKQKLIKLIPLKKWRRKNER